MKRIAITNLYGIKEGSKAYMRKLGLCFDFCWDKKFASEYTDEEAEKIFAHKDYYLKMFNAEEMIVEEARASKRQMAKIIHNGTWRVIFDEGKTVNPYRVTLNNRKVTDYADMSSCLWHIAQETIGDGNELRRI